MPFRSRYLFVCINRRPDGHPKGSCAEKGSEDIVLRTQGGARQARRGQGPGARLFVELPRPLRDRHRVVQEPEHVAYGGVTLDDVEAIADAAARGEVVARLVVHGPSGRTGEEAVSSVRRCRASPSANG